MHQDKAVHFLSYLLSHNIEFSRQDTWLLTSLAGIGSLNQSGSFATKVLELLRGHSRFVHIKRVCIAQRLGMSNQLRTLCSATSDDISDAMPTGYSCFVNPTGSIFKLSDQNMRVFPSVQNVVESFQKEAMPTQRSLSLINSMGLKSGICLGQFSRMQLKGLLFLNSGEAKDRETSGADYSIYALLSHLALGYLLGELGYSSVYTQLIEDREADCIGKAFDGQLLHDLLLKDMLRIAGAKPTVRIDADIQPTLVNHGHISQIFARLLASLSALPQNLSITVRSFNETLRFTVTHDSQTKLNENDYRVALAESDAKNIGLRVDLAHNQISIETPYDGIARCNYSTVA